MQKKQLNLAMTDTASELLYSEASPLILSNSLLKHIFEIHELVEDLLEKNKAKLDQNIQKHLASKKFDKTILKSQAYFESLAQILQALDERYKLEVLTSTPPFPKNVKFAINPKTLNVDQNLLFIADFLLKYYFVVQKIKLINVDIKKFDSATSLVIPSHYLRLIKTNMLAISKKHNIENNNEFILGLFYEHLPKVPHPYSSSSFGEIDFIKHTVSSNYFINNLKEIFLTKKRIAGVKSQDLQSIYSQYRWNIYIAGHGAPKEKASIIAGLTDQLFKNVLYFFNTHIDTNFVFVTSCYGAGERLPDFNIKNLNYTLVIGANTKTTTVKRSDYVLTINVGNKISLTFATNFSQFFKELRYGKISSYYDTLNFIQTLWYKNAKSKDKFFYQNIPQVKIPNTDWFRIIDLQKNELTINKLLVQLHEHNKKPIIINNKRMVFLYPQYTYEQFSEKDPKKGNIINQLTILSPIEIKGPKTPIFISMAHDNAIYNITSIDYPNSLSRLILKLIGLPTQEYNTKIRIKSLTIPNPFLSSKTYKGKTQDINIFTQIAPQLTSQKNASQKITLNNITIKAKKIVPTHFKVKFVYGGKQYAIEQNSYNDLKQKLKSSSLDSSFIKVEPIQKSSTFDYTPIGNFNYIEEALESGKRKKRAEILKKHVSVLQILESNLKNLGTIHYNQKLELLF